MMKFNKIRGTEDRFFEEANDFNLLINALSYVAKLNGYSQVITPIFENADLFVRSVGNTSDIVQKEFYDFKDKSDRHIVLRPEGTVGVIRALIEEKILYKKQLPVKVFYYGPMFRYERPQSGRLRQFNQFGIECVGTNNVYEDANILLMADSFLKLMGIKNYEILINNIGNNESRVKWINELKIYFKKFEQSLSEDSKNRINVNPLRILDDKIDGEKGFVKNAPKIDQFLSQEEIDYFKKLTSILTKMKLKFRIDDTLVRGLDYYTNFVFEINSTISLLKGQPTLIGGGKYAYLVKELNGPDLVCCGFALGIERLLIQCQSENSKISPSLSIDVCIACLDESAKLTCLAVSKILNIQDISCICNFDTIKLDKHFKYAKDNLAKYIIIIGKNEIENKKVIIKNQNDLSQEIIDNNEIVKYLKTKLK